MYTNLPKIKYYLLAITALHFSLELTAQNHLYTTEQFGIYGAMLGGAITSGAEEVTMTFYNPASIHKVAPQFNISLVQPSIRSFGFGEFWENDESSKLNTRIKLKPTVISFKFKFKKLDFAFLRISKSELTDAFSTKQETLENNLLTTRFFDYEYSGNDDWYGVGSNLKLKPNFYIGLSQFLSNSSFSYRNRALFQELNTSQGNQLVRYFDSNFVGNYSNLGLVTRFGILLNTHKHNLGV